MPSGRDLDCSPTSRWVDRTTPDIFDHFQRAVQDVEEIEECHMTAGGFDYLLKIRSRSMADFRRFVGTKLGTLPGLRQTATYFVKEQVKNQSRLNLKAAATAGSTTRSNLRKRARPEAI